MNIYVLKPKDNEITQNVWKTYYDKCHGFVVIAENNNMARKMCSRDPHVGDEGRIVWMDPLYTSCHLVGLAKSTRREMVLTNNMPG